MLSNRVQSSSGHWRIKLLGGITPGAGSGIPAEAFDFGSGYPNKRVYMLVGWNAEFPRAMTGLTVDGNAATRLARSGDGTDLSSMELWYIDDVSGSLDIAGTFNGAIFGANIRVFEVVNYVDGTVYDSAGYGPTTGASGSAVIDTINNGFVLVGAVWATSGVTVDSVSGWTEVATFSFYDFGWDLLPSTASAQTKSITLAASREYLSLLAVCINK